MGISNNSNFGFWADMSGDGNTVVSAHSGASSDITNNGNAIIVGIPYAK